MLYRKIPKTGDELSILGFGCMRLPLTKDHRIDEERATRQVRGAIDRGVNYLDTAWPYHAGQSESFLGRALAGGYREKVRIATKLPSWMIHTTEDMDTYLDAQREKLQTDRIDYYLLHGLSGSTWDRLQALGALHFLDKAKKDGRIVNAGFSFHGVLGDFRRIVDAYDWEFCQIQYNYLDVENQAGTQGLEYAAAKDLGVVIMEPLRGGNLGMTPPPADIAAVWQRATKKRTPVAWALRWIWNRPEVTVILSGMNEEAHIEENLAVADRARPDSLSQYELKLVEEAGRRYRALMKVDCTGCGYCTPCPSDVAIPRCFEIYNKLHLFGNAEEAKFTYAAAMAGLFSGTPSYASQCVRCEACLEKCPQHIQIPDLLETVAAEMEDEHLDRRIAVARKMLNME